MMKPEQGLHLLIGMTDPNPSDRRTEENQAIENLLPGESAKWPLPEKSKNMRNRISKKAAKIKAKTGRQFLLYSRSGFFIVERKVAG